MFFNTDNFGFANGKHGFGYAMSLKTGKQFNLYEVWSLMPQAMRFPVAISGLKSVRTQPFALAMAHWLSTGSGANSGEAMWCRAARAQRCFRGTTRSPAV
ncbi:hypothetical protein [Ochrobactrum sp. 3-3]|uniref:hypothetical protein n=1 Tax=Ochrobactrum sp. 3-3 TaxID=1830124 RepID=UPI0013B3E2F9|nr:hypothetical protein [Ochrobactrum sp. 3-3]